MFVHKERSIFPFSDNFSERTETLTCAFSAKARIAPCSDPLNQQSLIGFFAKTGGNP